MSMKLINIVPTVGEIVRAKGRDPAPIAARRSAAAGHPYQTPANPDALTFAGWA
jgi:hypothetical protein